MICKRSFYRQFRNIKDQTIEFSPGINVIYGENAEGKTNAVEGIYLCSQGRSHRTFHEKDFIGFESESASVGVVYETAARGEVSLGIRYMRSGGKVCDKNRVPVTKMSEFIGNFRTVIFTPEHLQTVKSSPQFRRRFLDSAISQISPVYIASLQRYTRALVQRNKLLSLAKERGNEADPSIEVWSLSLAKEAATISRMRNDYVEKLGVIVSDIFSDMTSGKEKPEIFYRTLCSEEEYVKMFTSSVEREIRFGTTLFGPHKDDMDILLNSREAKNFASQGQQRSLALALKLSEGEISKLSSGEYPVFLLDDVLSELDEKRRDFIVSRISGKQVIVTSCDQNRIPGAKMIHCKDGRYEY